jgi:hypothetical protein
MLTLCASAWGQDTVVWKDPTGVTPGEVDVTVIVGADGTYYYVVKNVSFPTVQDFLFNFGDFPITGPSGWSNSDPSVAFTVSFVCINWVAPGICSSSDWDSFDEAYMMTGGIPPGSQAVFQVYAPNTSPQVTAGSEFVHYTGAPFCYSSLDPFGVEYAPNPICSYPSPTATGALIYPQLVKSATLRSISSPSIAA